MLNIMQDLDQRSREAETSPNYILPSKNPKTLVECRFITSRQLHVQD